MDQLIAMVTERPYVLAFLASFIVIAAAERGWLRMLFWLASGTFIGWLVEFSSTRNGFPFGHYSYHEDRFPDELFIAGVPLFASLSFAFLTYFGYSIACTLLSPLTRRGFDVHRESAPDVDRSLRVLALAAIITTWVDTVIDPVAHLGKYWFLGDLYNYRTPGFHFDVPLSNYAGWVFTSLAIVLVNQLFDGLVRVPHRGFHLPSKPLWALGTIFGNFLFIIGVTVYLLNDGDVPASEPVAGVLASGLALSGAFAIASLIIIARRLQREPTFAPQLQTLHET